MTGIALQVSRGASRSAPVATAATRPPCCRSALIDTRELLSIDRAPAERRSKHVEQDKRQDSMDTYRALWALAIGGLAAGAAQADGVWWCPEKFKDQLVAARTDLEFPGFSGHLA